MNNETEIIQPAGRPKCKCEDARKAVRLILLGKGVKTSNVCVVCIRCGHKHYPSVEVS